MSLPEFGVKKAAPANLVMLAMVIAGVVLGLSLRREFFPEVDPDQVLITAPYPGAAPDEVESALAIKIEDRVSTLEGVKEITTTIVEGLATIMVEFEPRVRIGDAVARVKREVDALQDLPERSERIIVDELEPRIPVVDLTLFGGADERVLKDAIQRMRDDLERLPGMGDITLGGVRVDEISVDIRPEELVRHGLSLPDVSGRVRAAMQELPGGTVRGTTANISVRTVGAQELASEVRDIVVKGTPGGGIVRLGDIARVTQGFADADVRLRFNGQPAVSLTVFAEGDQDVVEIAEMVKAYRAGRLGEGFRLRPRDRRALEGDGAGGMALSPVAQAYQMGLAHRAPPPGELEIGQDLSRFVTGRLDLLSRNAMQGGALVFVSLLLLLAPSVAFWVTAGLVISLLGTLAVMSLAGISLNLLTMFGLIIVLGLLVDDAIVVAENIVARHETGESAMQAAIRGTEQVLWPVVATVLTTVCAFMPLRLIEGRIGDLLGTLPLVVAVALFASLVESLLILPSHMAHSLKRQEKRGDTRLTRASKWAERQRERFFQGLIGPRYERLLRAALRARYLTLSIALATLIGSLGLVAGGRVPFEFLTSADSETVLANLRMPVGTTAEETNRVIERIERATLGMPEVQSVIAFVGATNDIEGGVATEQSNRGQVFIMLRPVEERERSSQAVTLEIQGRLGDLPGVDQLRFEEIGGGPGGPPLSYSALGSDVNALSRVAARMKARLAEYDGVFSIADDADEGQRELRIEPLAGASELGFTVAHIAEQVRGAVYGLEAYTFASNREDVDVRVRFDEESRRSVSEIESMRVFSPAGVPVPLQEVAEVREGRGYASINRLNRQRAINVSADVNRTVVSPEKVAADFEAYLRELETEFPGVRIVPRGRQEDMRDSFATLPLGLGAALVMIYVILAWLFSSYLQPLFVLSAVPFALVGVVWGHLLLGFELTVLSMIGFVALTGIVVNDSLILMEFYNHRRREGSRVYEAAVEAGRARLRAIILTTLTTVLGLLPLMLEQSFQARFLIPMAITIAFGLLAATLVTLLVLPCLLLVLADVQRGWRWLWTGGAVKWDERLRAPGE